MWWRLANYTVKTSAMKGICYVCVIVGDSCCIYVPDNDADGHLIDQGIKNITKAVVEMTSRERNRDDWNLSFSSLFQKIEHWLTLIVIIISCILVLLCLWPCIMAMICRALKSSLSMIMKGYYVAQARPEDKVTTNPNVM